MSDVLRMKKVTYESLEKLVINNKYNNKFGKLKVENYHKVGSVEVVMQIFEKLYFRSSSIASLSLLFIKNENEVTIDIAATGSGVALMNFDLGSSKNYLKEAEDFF